MSNVKLFWNNLSKSQRLGIIRENHFWDDLSVFDYKLLPNDLIVILTRKIKEKPHLNGNLRPI